MKNPVTLSSLKRYPLRDVSNSYAFAEVQANCPEDAVDRAWQLLNFEAEATGSAFDSEPRLAEQRCESCHVLHSHDDFDGIKGIFETNLEAMYRAIGYAEEYIAVNKKFFLEFLDRIFAERAPLNAAIVSRILYKTGRYRICLQKDIV